MAGVPGLRLQRHQRVQHVVVGGGNRLHLHVLGLVVLDGGVVDLAQVLPDTRVLPPTRKKIAKSVSFQIF